MCVIAAVSVVFPWSTCPIVPTFTCGLVRSNLLCHDVFPSLLFFAGGILVGVVAIDNSVCDVLWRLGVMLELHRVGGAALGRRAQRGRVTEHLGKRDLGLDDLDANDVLHALNDAPPR